MNNIEKIAKKKRITSTEIIDATRIGRSHFYDIRAGRVLPRIDTAWKIAEFLNVNINTLFPNK